MIGESRLQPRCWSTVPGRHSPTPWMRAVAVPLEEHVEPLDHVGHQLVGTDADLLVDVTGGQDLACEVAHRQPGPAAPDRGGQHDARRRR